MKRLYRLIVLGRMVEKGLTSSTGWRLTRHPSEHGGGLCPYLGGKN